MSSTVMRVPATTGLPIITFGSEVISCAGTSASYRARVERSTPLLRPHDPDRPHGQIFEGWTAPDLRPYREAALLAWELAELRGLIDLPTGSGKTMAAMARTGLSTLCLVPTRVLFDQWHSVISSMWSGRVGRLGDGAREVERGHGDYVRKRLLEHAPPGQPIRSPCRRRGITSDVACETKPSRCRSPRRGWDSLPLRRSRRPCAPS